MIHAILFDLDDTLFDATSLAEKARRAAIESMIEKGLEGITAEKGYEILNEVVREYGSNYSRHFDMFLKRLQHYSLKLVSVAIITYHRVKVQDIRLYPDVFRFLQNLRHMTSCELGLITDGLPIKQYEKVIRLGLDTFFERVVISDEIGIRKPNPELFTHSLSLLDIEPGKALYVGDNYANDMIPAKSVGMKTCFVHRGGKHDIEIDSNAVDFEIHDFSELWKKIHKMLPSK
ncbi:TIGR02253 family HAD-type hydrolase [Candidatus Bathyarchaeota archaeon]|nr:TIGR02253 family HAD-type hydrolase [Candidatus Bathyarchaeota archaeon]